MLNKLKQSLVWYIDDLWYSAREIRATYGFGHSIFLIILVLMWLIAVVIGIYEVLGY